MVLLMTSKIAKDLAPSYISNLIKPYIPPWALCAQRMGLLPELKRSQLAARDFPIVPPFTGLTSLLISASLTPMRILNINLKIIYSA